MKKFALFASFIAIPLGIFSFSNVKNADAVTNAQSPVVLELFTSQSCSSCPPADKLLGQFAAESENVIALTCNVTYWDHLHWKDTLSKDFCTQRQRQYVQTLRSRGPYTPQIMINGKHTMVGSRGSAINRTIASELEGKTVQAIDLSLSDDTLNIDLPQIATGSYTLLLVSHGSEHTQSIPSGENRGRTVSYTNPIETITSLGTWDGTAKSLSHDVSELKNASGYAILAQENGFTGPILAAAQVKR